MKLTKCAIALGSNLGDSLATLSSAIVTLNNTPEIAVKSHSSWYQTAPVGPPQPDYINACAILEVALQPEQLLAKLLEIEIKFNRVRREKWGPRTLDLDLLLYDNLILETPTLTLPHLPDDRKSFCISTFSRNCPGLGASGDEKCDRPTPANSRLFRSAKIATVKIEQNSPRVPVSKKCNRR
jgi:2-amino-4-hydroxy-6-hydroxymethyldihydropteridine diphosphokinase